MAAYYKKTIVAFFGVFLCSVLVLSFGLHTFELKHVHPGDHPHHHDESVTEILGDYMHSTEKKSFLFILASLFVGALYITKHTYHKAILRVCRFAVSAIVSCVRQGIRYFSYLLICYRKGLLNTKTYRR